MSRRRRGPPRGLGRRGWVILGLSVAALAAFVALNRPTETEDPDERPLLSRVPAEAVLVAEIDLGTLRRTAIGERLLGEGRNVAELGAVRELCGFDPIDALDRVAFVVPELEGAGFGLFGAGSFEAERMLRCAETIVERRDGDPRRSDAGAYTVLRDASLGVDSASLAVTDGVLILAEPSYVAQVERTAPEDSLARDPTHRALLDLVPEGVVRATASLTPEQKRTLLEELAAAGEADSPYGSVQGAALSIRLGETLDLVAILRCGEPAACEGIRDRLAARRDAAREQPVVKLLGLGELLASSTIGAERERVRAELSVTTDQLLAVIRRLELLDRLLGGERPQRPPRSAPSVPPTAGERVEPPRPAASAAPRRRPDPPAPRPTGRVETPRPPGPDPPGRAKTPRPPSPRAREPSP